MPNNLELATQFIPVLDAVYKAASLTAKLDGAADLARQGANANELIVPMLDMDGLGDYDRSSGYVKGSVSLKNETVKCNFDRGRKFTVDNVDNQESANIAFGRLSGEFIRTKVTPELDAFRFAKYASCPGISSAYAALAKGDAVVAALRAAITQMDEDEVPADQRHLFITSTLFGLVNDLDTTKSREVLGEFASVTKVPQSRFYTSIKQLSGKEGEEEKGGYQKGDGAQDINFMVIHTPALIQFSKHIAPKIVSPDLNPDADAYIFGYRHVGIADVYKNKAAGIYLHAKAKPTTPETPSGGETA